MLEELTFDVFHEILLFCSCKDLAQLWNAGMGYSSSLAKITTRATKEEDDENQFRCCHKQTSNNNSNDDDEKKMKKEEVIDSIWFLRSKRLEKVLRLRYQRLINILSQTKTIKNPLQPLTTTTTTAAASLKTATYPSSSNQQRKNNSSKHFHVMETMDRAIQDLQQQQPAQSLFSQGPKTITAYFRTHFILLHYFEYSILEQQQQQQHFFYTSSNHPSTCLPTIEWPIWCGQFKVLFLVQEEEQQQQNTRRRRQNNHANDNDDEDEDDDLSSVVINTHAVQPQVLLQTQCWYPSLLSQIHTMMHATQCKYVETSTFFLSRQQHQNQEEEMQWARVLPHHQQQQQENNDLHELSLCLDRNEQVAFPLVWKQPNFSVLTTRLGAILYSLEVSTRQHQLPIGALLQQQQQFGENNGPDSILDAIIDPLLGFGRHPENDNNLARRRRNNNNNNNNAGEQRNGEYLVFFWKTSPKQRQEFVSLPDLAQSILELMKNMRSSTPTTTRTTIPT